MVGTSWRAGPGGVGVGVGLLLVVVPRGAAGAERVGWRRRVRGGLTSAGVSCEAALGVWPRPPAGEAAEVLRARRGRVGDGGGVGEGGEGWERGEGRRSATSPRHGRGRVTSVQTVRGFPVHIEVQPGVL